MTAGDRARIALQARAARDPRWFNLVLRLVARLAIDPFEVIRQIELLATKE